jgi:hypothetical protein
MPSCLLSKLELILVVWHSALWSASSISSRDFPISARMRQLDKGANGGS